MKKLFIIALLITAVNSQAQLGNIKNRLKTKVEDKVVEKAENKIDKTADDITTKKNKNEATENKKEPATETINTANTTATNSKNEEMNVKKEETPTGDEKKTGILKVDETSKGKMFFDSKPFNTNGNSNITSFTSKEFIYARIELPENVKSFFKMNEPQTGESYCLQYFMTVYDGDMETGSNSWSTMYVGKNEMTLNYLNFDVLPLPDKANTVMSPLKEFGYGLAAAPLGSLINASTFPRTGKYKITISIYNQTYNGYGSEKPREEWPICKGEFNFDFNEDDISNLQANSKKANELVKENFRKREREEADLPESWNMQSSSIGSGYTEQQIKGMISARYQGSKLNKLVIEPEKGGWVVEKNELGLPKGKYFDQIISIFITDSEKNCFYIEGYVYKTYEGGGTYGSAWMYPEKKIQIACDKMK